MVGVPGVIPSTGGATGPTFEKLDPHDGTVLWQVDRPSASIVDQAVAVAATAQRSWADVPPVTRGRILHDVANALERRTDEMAAIVAAETRKSPGEAAGEVGGAVALARFYAGEGQRLYGRTTTSGTADRQAMTIRRPVGVCGLIVPANTPIANVAWKAFPALVCGNAAVLKASEDAPATAWLFAEIAAEAGLPDGVLHVLQGIGSEVGARLVEHPDVGVISFTGSTRVGREVAAVAGARLAKVSLELGGRNPFVVCDDADLDLAVRWALASAFSNAGQRCASGSRLIVMDAVYEAFRDRFVAKAERLRLGPDDGDDLGPVINGGTLERLLGLVDSARSAGAKVLTGGDRADEERLRHGWYLRPTVLEVQPGEACLATDELFGPVTVLTRVTSFADAVAEAEASPYGLTAAIHTRSWNRGMDFAVRVRSGVATVNGGTYGSEPHMPFGGVGWSGNGSREPGTEALDLYSDLKDLYLHVDREGLDS